MRHINAPTSQSAPDSFKRWKRKHQNAKYDRFRDSRAKAELKSSLVRRQKCLCCYCESRINDDTSHIEHIEPQFGGISSHTMDYTNMAASCIKDPRHYEDLKVLSDASFANSGSSLLHCGHARGCKIVVSPYDSRCEHMFEYSFSGEIRVAESLDSAVEIQLAKDSIEFLRLNVKSLVELRKLAMYETVKMLSDGLSSDDILREIAGKLPPYISAAETAIRLWNKTDDA